MKKLNEENVIKYFESKGYEILDKYKDYHTPIVIKKDGYKCQISYGHLKDGSSPILFGSKCPFWKENIKRFLSINAPQIEFIDAKSCKKSGKTRTIIFMKCKCGNKFKKTWEHIYGNKNHIMCSKCSSKNSNKKRKIATHKKYYENIVKRGYILVDKTHPLQSNTYVEVIQKHTGYRGFIYPNNNKRMVIFSLLNNKDNYIYNMNIYADLHGINSRAICFKNDGKWGEKTILFKCGCGNYFETNERGITQNKTICDKCSQLLSSYERLVCAFLTTHKIDYFTEFRFNSCKDIYPLPFDFYLKDYKCLIEVDGEHHFVAVKFGNMTDKQADIRLKDYQRRDAIKDEYCKKYKIPLLRVNYQDIKTGNYKEKILDFIQTVQE